MERVVSFAKRRGFLYPSSEIYGGLSAVWDFGPYGVQLKNNLKRFFWRRFVESREDIVGLETAILTRPEILAASGHEKNFSDVLVECKNCHLRFRADQLGKNLGCEKGGEHRFTPPRDFNLMFKTQVGPVQDETGLVYLRPETAQGMFVNFRTILETTRQKIPFGVAQIGKSFRNEITTGDFIFRSREFEIAEIEYFVEPGEDDPLFDRWLKDWLQFFLDTGLSKERLRLKKHDRSNLAHYSKATTDIEYHFPFGWSEIAGVANRGDFDLKAHQAAAHKDLQYFDEAKKKRYLPFVIEPTLGLERLLLALLVEGLKEIGGGRRSGEDQEETVFKIKPNLAPVKAAVFPLVKKDGLPEMARRIFNQLKDEFVVEYDEVGSIGRRYRRQDEIGTPFCVTVDFDSLKEQTVTIRDRDTMKQERLSADQLKTKLQELRG